MKAFLFFESPVTDHSLIEERIAILKAELDQLSSFESTASIYTNGTILEELKSKKEEEINDINEELEICKSIIEIESKL